MRRLALGLLVAATPLVLILAQTAGGPAPGTYEGAPAVILSNGKLALTVLVKGATIADLVLADATEKISPLWNSIRLSREAGRTPPAGGAMGHFVCVDGFGPVSAEERDAGLMQHGEAHLQTFTVHSNKDGRVAELAMTANLPIVQENFSRTFRMVDGENVVYVESSLESMLGFDHSMEWAEHATVASPFVEPGATVFDLSGSKSSTRPYQAGANPNSQTVRRLASGREFTWPMAPGLDGNSVDMRVTPVDAHYIDHTTTLLDPSREYEWTTALNLKRHLLYGYILRRQDYPWLQTWDNYQPNGQLVHGMEFASQPYDVTRREAVALGTLFGEPAFRWLPAKSKIQTRFLFFYTPSPEGFARVDDVQMTGGRITIQDRHSGKEITLPASLPL